MSDMDEACEVIEVVEEEKAPETKPEAVEQSLEEKKREQMRRAIIIASIVLAAVVVVVLAVVIFFAIFFSVYYKPSVHAIEVAETNTSEYNIFSLRGGHLLFKPTNPSGAGFIIYPGAKIDHRSYAPLASAFAKRGVTCAIAMMPYKFALFNPDAASEIRSQIDDDSISWYLGGHSYGGYTATNHLASHQDEYKGALLLSAYALKDFTDSTLKFTLLYGSEDKVLNMKKYEQARSNLPQGYNEHVIDGGCHAFFGDYGAQKGDGTPLITREEQIEETFAQFTKMLS